MRRFFNILLGASAMIAVALLSAFVAMRLAIHGREVEIPNLAGLTVAEASNTIASLGLNMNLENHFYSTVVPPGRILSQYPAPGTKVRREWVMRVTESIGPQRVSVPNVVGQTEREASVTIRRLALDLGTVAYVPAPGPAGMVLAQTPTPAAAGVDGPRISLLVSEPLITTRPRQAATDLPAPAPSTAATTATQDASPAAVPVAQNPVADTAAQPAQAVAGQEEAYVMPNLIGLTLSAATAKVGAMGLHITSMEVRPTVIKPVGSIPAPSAIGSGPSAILKPVAPMAPITMANTVISQSPAIGHRVTKTYTIHLVLSH